MNRLIPLILLGAAACGPAHIQSYEPKRREYEPIVAAKPAEETREDGAIWSPSAGGNTLVTDVRAYRTNDIVTVRVEELASAKRSAGTRTRRDGSIEFGGDAFSLLRDNTALDPERLLYAESGTAHDASGRTSRDDEVRFKVAATVTKVLPNGNLFLEGHRVVLVNDEEHHFYVSGVARPADIAMDNSISSVQLADAQIEFVGDGVMSEGQQPGWLTRILNYINPL